MLTETVRRQINVKIVKDWKCSFLTYIDDTWFPLKRNHSKAWNLKINMPKTLEIFKCSPVVVLARFIIFCWIHSTSFWMWDRMLISDSLGKASESPRLYNASPHQDRLWLPHSILLHYNENSWMNSSSRFFPWSVFSLTSGFHSYFFISLRRCTFFIFLLRWSRRMHPRGWEKERETERKKI